MGIFDEINKERKRQTLRENVWKGRQREEGSMMSSRISGHIVERTGRGSDYAERPYNPVSGRAGPRTLVEVKSSRTAPVSRLQQQTRRRTRRYRLERDDSWW